MFHSIQLSSFDFLLLHFHVQFVCSSVLYSSDYWCTPIVSYVQIPLSSANEDLQPVLASKRRILALNKKDLANPNIMNVSVHWFLAQLLKLSCQFMLKHYYFHVPSQLCCLANMIYYLLTRILHIICRGGFIILNHVSRIAFR